MPEPQRDPVSSFVTVLFVIVAVVGLGAAAIGAFLFFPGTNQLPVP
jgi:hypothetical protein